MRASAQETPFSRLFLRFFCAVTLGIVAACRANNPIDARDVSFATDDNQPVQATRYAPAAARPPAFLLLHMLGSDRSAWDTFARAAAARGFMSLAVDLDYDAPPSASTGDTSGSGPQSQQQAIDHVLRQSMPAAVDYLIDNGADPENIFIIGASLGANLGLRYAVGDDRVQAVVMLSPGENYRGVTALPELSDFTQRPLLILATEGDSYSAATSRRMHDAAQNQCELRIYPGSAHGTGVLNAVPTAPGQIFLWIDPIVQREAAAN